MPTKSDLRYWLCLLLAPLTLWACAGPTSRDNIRKAAAIREIGEAYMLQGDYTTALRELHDARQLYPQDHIVHFDLGVCYTIKKRMPDAIVHFKRAIALKPSYVPARNNLGTVYLETGKWDAAIKIFKGIAKEALYATPHYPLSNLGLAYYHKGEYQAALEYYRQALKIEANFVNALRGAGRVYLAMKDGRMAAGYLKRALKLAPKAAEIHFDMAEASLLTGRLDQAKAYFETVIVLEAPESDLSAKAAQRLRSMR